MEDGDSVMDDGDKARGVPRWVIPGALGLALLAGVVLRWLVYGQSLVGDELSTLWIVRNHGFTGVVDFVSGDGEISPPLYFLLAWLASKLGSAPDLIRLPSLLAGIASLPLYYLLGLRLFGRAAARFAFAIAALSPILVYFSANGRAYAVMLFFLLLSTLAMLRAADEGRARWWVVYGIASCLAMYSHYTAAFVLAAQLGWLLVTDPGARVRALVTNAVAALAFLPWIPSYLADADSPTTPILEALQGSGFEAKRIAVEQLLFWHMMPGTWDLGGRWDVIVIVAGVMVAAVGAAVAASRAPGIISRLRSIDRNLVLVLLLIFVTPVGALVLGLFSTDIFGGRNLAAAWTGLPLLLGALLAACGTFWAVAGTALLLTGLTAGSVQLADSGRSEVRYADAAAFIASGADPGDSLIDTSHLTPVPLTPLDAYLTFPGDEYRVNLPESDPPFLPGVAVANPADQVREAFADGERVYLSTLFGHEKVSRDNALHLAGVKYPIPPGWKVTEQRVFDGLYPITVTVIDRDPGQPPAKQREKGDD